MYYFAISHTHTISFNRKQKFYVVFLISFCVVVWRCDDLTDFHLASRGNFFPRYHGDNAMLVVDTVPRSVIDTDDLGV